MNKKIIFKGNPVTLVGRQIKVGMPAPDFKVVAPDLKEISLPAKCKPCEAGTPSLPKEKIDRLIAQYKGWQLVEEKKITKEFKFKDFVEAKYFLDLVSVIAEEQGHHPTLTLTYGKLKITLTTHAASGLTENDFIMAKLIDGIEV